jgi:hypothetical protein
VCCVSIGHFFNVVTRYGTPSTVWSICLSVQPDYYLFTENRLAMNLAPYVLGLKGPAQTLSLCPDLPVRLHVKRRPTPRDPRQPTNADATAAASQAADFVVECPSWFCIHTSHATQSLDGRTLKLYSSGWPKQTNGPDGKPPAFLGAW